MLSAWIGYRGRGGLVALAIGACGLLQGCAGTGMAGISRIFPEREPAAVPSFAFEDAEGRQRTLADFRGRPVLVNLWAPWCAACVEELPALETLQETFRDTPLQVVAIGIAKHGVPRVRTIYENLGVTTLDAFADDEGATVHSLNMKAVPLTLLIDAQGREIGRVSKAQVWDSGHAAREIAARLGLSLPGPVAGRSVVAALPQETALGLADQADRWTGEALSTPKPAVVPGQPERGVLASRLALG